LEENRIHQRAESKDSQSIERNKTMRTTTIFQIIGWVGVLCMIVMYCLIKFAHAGNIYEFMMLYGMTLSWFIASIIAWLKDVMIPKSKLNMQGGK
jgi:hypothetical protein